MGEIQGQALVMDLNNDGKVSTDLMMSALPPFSACCAFPYFPTPVLAGSYASDMEVNAPVRTTHI